MFRIFVLLLIIWVLPIKLLATDIEIIADVNEEPISNLDIEKRIKLIDSLFGNQNANTKEVKSQILRQLIDEIVIINESKRLNIKLSDEELNNAVVLFFTQNFKLKVDEVDQYIKKHNIDRSILTKQIKPQLLWNKVIEARIIPFISISDKEVNDAKRRVEKPDCLIAFQEIIIPNQENTDAYSIAEDLAKELRENNDFIPKFPIKIHKTTVSLNQLKNNLKGILERLEVGDVTDPTSSSEGYSIIKIIDKVQLDRALQESIVRIKQIIVKDSKSPLSNLKEQKANCSNLDKLANDLHLPEVKEFEIKMKDLNPDVQILLSKSNIDELIEVNEDNTSRLIMLCNIKNNEASIEEIKQRIYQQKIITQSNLLFDNMRKNAIINYQHNN